MKKLVIYGAGGFTLQISGTLRELVDNGIEVVIVDDGDRDELLGFPVLRSVPEDAKVAIAIANPRTRKAIAERLRNFGGVQALSAIVSDHAVIGEGAIICDQVIIEAEARIGRHFHANIYSYVAHECVIGDYVTFAPRVSCNGNVQIGDGAYIGTGAIIRQGIKGKPLVIGEGATVGMGAVVTKDVPAWATVYGNPARVK